MKHKLFVCLVFFSHALTYGQEKNESTIVSSGNTIVMDGGSLDWIIGENLLDHQILFGNNRPEDVFPELLNNRFHVFPVVTAGPVTLVSKEMEPENLNINIHDMTGKLILSQKWIENPMKIDITDCTEGMYLIRIVQHEQSPLATFKVVKK